MSKIKALFSSVQLGNNKLKNRIALAPLTRGRAGKTRIANDLMKEYYLQRKSAGMLITEGTFISEQAIGWNGAPGIFTKEQTEGWKRLMTAFKKESDTPVFVQLWHTGRSSHSTFRENGKLPVAPSPIPLTGKSFTPKGQLDFETPHALTIQEIKDTVNDFKNAALNAKNAGFNGVEIHAANGYLIDEFLQSKTNLRTDEYGGSFQNRFRFLREIIEAISSVLPSNQIAVRFSPNGVYNDMGSPDFRESFSYYIQQLNDFDLAYLHVMDGLGFGFHQLGEPISLSDVRKLFKGTLIGNCGYNFETANQAIENNLADIIAFGRPFISNPDLVERLANNWPLNDLPPYELFYSEGAEGYTDFPFYDPKANA